MHSQSSVPQDVLAWEYRNYGSVMAARCTHGICLGYMGSRWMDK